jgi:hypothetical protein
VDTPQKVQFGVAVSFGIAGLAVILTLAIFIPVPTLFQYQVFRIILALAAGGVASMIPGILSLQISNFITAGGALAVFVVVYFYSPAQLAVRGISPDPSPTPSLAPSPSVTATPAPIPISTPTPTPIPPSVHLYSTQLQVPATSDWLPPITIPDQYDNRPIAKVIITASGSWSGDAHSGRYNGPGGNGVRAAGNFPLPGISEWCLLVRINGGPTRFFRNDTDQIAVNPPCTLSFRINDAKLDDNGGFMDVTLNECKVKAFSAMRTQA